MPAMDMTEREFRELFEAVSNWGRWNDGGQRGALNHLTPSGRRRGSPGASGDTVTLSQPLRTEARIDVPQPADHHMTMLTDVDIGSGSVRFAKDYVGVDYHNDGHRHIDAFCHVAFDGSFFDGEPAAGHRRRAQPGAIDILKDGLVGRAVLLDVPRVRGVPWLEPGDHVFREDLEAAERELGVRVGTGDILLVRTGHTRRLAEREPWDTREAKAGLHPTTAPFLADREVAALGSDGNSDTAPSTTEGVGFPIHVLAITAMGVHLLDYLQFEDVAPHCEDRTLGLPVRGRSAANRRGTGSPLNPTAIF